MIKVEAQSIDVSYALNGISLKISYLNKQALVTLH